ncbi:MAG: DUF115 domain-containing protein [Spirochaetaceae bacterium]|nr:MAG: DUF115 domain-containing protein [Spirochaetaceae bacterium]
MMNYTAVNLEALYGRQPDLKAKALESSQGQQRYEIADTPAGRPTAQLAGAFLHSRYDPMKEARRIVARETATAPSAAVVLGFGMGYLAEAFSEYFPDRPLLVVEQDPGLFLQALAARDLRTLLSRPSTRWCIGDQAEAVMTEVEKLPLQKLCILRLVALSKFEYYRRVETLLSSIFDRRKVNINTLRRFGELWVRNLLKNLGSFITNPGIRVGRSCFSNIPALILAAGPSLDEVLPHLEALRERLLIVAVDTSYRFCRSKGVEADFLVTVDPQYWNSRHLDWLPRGGTILVSESSAHPRVFRSAGGQEEEIFYVSSFFPLGSYIERIIGQRGLIGAGGSVATTAWDLCRYFGCPCIYMAGLDLGFPGKRTHARGAFFEESMHGRSFRYVPVEQMSFDYLHQARPTALKNNRGEWTLTDRRMLIYKSWFENQLKQQPRQSGPATFTLAAEGIAVEGMEHIQLRELLRLPPLRRRIDTVLSDLRRRGRQMAQDQRAEPVVDSLRKLELELQQLQELARSGIELSGSGRAAAALVPALAEVDQKIMSLASRQIAGFLFQPLIHMIVDNPEGGRDFTEVMATSRELYRELAESASYHGQLLRQCLERL